MECNKFSVRRQQVRTHTHTHARTQAPKHVPPRESKAAAVSSKGAWVCLPSPRVTGAATPGGHSPGHLCGAPGKGRPPLGCTHCCRSPTTTKWGLFRASTSGVLAEGDEGRGCHRAMGPLSPTRECCRDKPGAEQLLGQRGHQSPLGGVARSFDLPRLF